jgi:hypothetical protein
MYYTNSIHVDNTKYSIHRSTKRDTSYYCYNVGNISNGILKNDLHIISFNIS